MLTSRLTRLVHSVRTQTQRNFGASVVVLQKLDPIQQLFVDKLREYKTKGLAKTLEADPTMKMEISRIQGIFGVKKGEDMTSMPPQTFSDPVIGPVDLGGIGPENESAIANA